MNGYQMSADAYKDYIARENPAGETLKSAERKIKALEIMAQTDRQTQYELFNSGGFNSICKGYMLKSLENIGVDAETRQRATAEMGALFDETTAEQAERYFMGN